MTSASILTTPTMAAQLTNADISRLLAVRKPLPADVRSRVQTRAKRGHKERELEVSGDDGSEFRLILRQSTLNALDSSIILAYRVPGTNQVFAFAATTGRAMSTRTHSSVRRSTTSTSTRRPSVTRTPACARTPSPSRPTGTPISTAPCVACWPSAVSSCPRIHRRASSEGGWRCPRRR